MATALGLTRGARVVSERPGSRRITPGSARPGLRRPLCQRPAEARRLRGRETVSSLDAGRAIARARSQEAGKWEKNSGGHMNEAATNAAVATPNHSSAGVGDGRSDAAATAAATKPIRPGGEQQDQVAGMAQMVSPITSCIRIQADAPGSWYRQRADDHALVELLAELTEQRQTTRTPPPHRLRRTRPLALGTNQHDQHGHDRPRLVVTGEPEHHAAPYLPCAPF